MITGLFRTTSWTVALVVLLSVVVHGGMLMAWQDKLGARPPVASDLLISVDEYRDLTAARQSAHLIDVRSSRDWNGSDLIATGAIRTSPNDPVESAAARALPKNDWLIAYCA